MKIESILGTVLSILWGGFLLLVCSTSIVSAGATELVLECPGCAVHLVEIKHDPLAADTDILWFTDGVSRAYREVDLAQGPVVKCQQCGHVFLREEVPVLEKRSLETDPCNRLATPLFGENRPSFLKQQISCSLSRMKDAGEKDYFALIKERDYAASREMMIRMQVWQMSNNADRNWFQLPELDLFLEDRTTCLKIAAEKIAPGWLSYCEENYPLDRHQSFDPIEVANLERLVILLSMEDDRQRLTIAEVYRELGRFDQALAILDKPFQGSVVQKDAQIISRLAEHKMTRIWWLRFEQVKKSIWPR